MDESPFCPPEYILFKLLPKHKTQPVAEKFKYDKQYILRYIPNTARGQAFSTVFYVLLF